MMRSLFNILLILFAGLSLQAQSAEELFEKGNALYQEGEFVEAISAYEAVLTEGKHSADLHYNLANAYFRNREIAKSILHYEKALKLEPQMEDAKHNLEFAYSKTIDKVEQAPKLFFYRWWDSVMHWFSLKSWALISLLFLALAVIGFGVFFFLSRSKLKKLSFYSGISLLILFIVSCFIAASLQRSIEHSKFAIILSPTVNINSSPSEGSSKLFVLHEGTKVKIEDNSGKWLEVSLPNGNSGWLQESTLEEI